MRYYPIFVDLAKHKVVFSGGGEMAVAKIRLLLKTPATIHVFCKKPQADVLDWACAGKIILHRRHLEPADLADAKLLYVSNKNDKYLKRAQQFGKQAKVFTNVIDNLAESEFLTPALVDRSPVTLAIGTEGTAPVLARKIKAQIETMLPISLGTLARLAQNFRPLVARIKSGKQRRLFWQNFFFNFTNKQIENLTTTNVREKMLALYNDVKNKSGKKSASKLTIIEVPHNNDSEWLNIVARKKLFDADVVVYEHGADKNIVELARREAEFIALRNNLAEIFGEIKFSKDIVLLCRNAHDIFVPHDIEYQIILSGKIILPAKIKKVA